MAHWDFLFIILLFLFLSLWFMEFIIIIIIIIFIFDLFLENLIPFEFCIAQCDLNLAVNLYKKKIQKYVPCFSFYISFTKIIIIHVIFTKFQNERKKKTAPIVIASKSFQCKFSIFSALTTNEKISFISFIGCFMWKLCDN